MSLAFKKIKNLGLKSTRNKVHETKKLENKMIVSN